MKFGKRLKRQVEETLPEWQDKFLSYKDLKKLVRLISATPTGLDKAKTEADAEAEADFICLLNVEVDKFNGFFLEQEEDFIIRQKELQERMQELVETVAPATAEYRAERGRISRDLVNLHGEMVLLENYSNINYTGLAKILKKYDKRTGRLLRLPFIEKVLKQPFFITDLISKLIKECEKTMDSVFPMTAEEREEKEKDNEQVAVAVAEQSIMRNTVAALATMREMRRGSSTYSHFSLPPLNLPDTDPQQPFQPPSPIPTQ